MKIKRIISSVLAFAAAAAIMSVPAFAAKEETVVDATYSFDKDTSLPQWIAYGPVEKTGLTYKISSEVKESGDGSLCVAESFKETLESGDRFGGIYVTAESLGLENFAGCVVQMSFMFDGTAAGSADAFTAFSDGQVWIDASVSAENNGRWSKIMLAVPESAKNDRVGFLIPVFEPYSGNVVYVDNVIVYKPDGKPIPNQGDYKVSESGIIVSIGTPGRIILICVAAVIMVGVVFGIIFVVKAFKKNFI